MNVLVRGILAFLLSFGIAHAALIDRGGGMIYDNVLNITWLQDANYAKTSGYDADGKMFWHEAMIWADSLNYGGYDDWRLPTVLPTNGISFTYSYSNSGYGDFGYNLHGTTSELAYMHYANLGNQSLLTPLGDFSGCQNNVPDMCQYNRGPFANLQSGIYWSETEIPPDSAFNFNMSVGLQYGSTKTGDEFYAWAVRDGDVQLASTVPEPPILILMLSALGIFSALRLRSGA